MVHQTEKPSFTDMDEKGRTDAWKEKCRNDGALKPNGAMTTDTASLKLKSPKRKDGFRDKMDPANEYSDYDDISRSKTRHGEA